MATVVESSASSRAAARTNPPNGDINIEARRTSTATEDLRIRKDLKKAKNGSSI